MKSGRVRCTLVTSSRLKASTGVECPANLLSGTVRGIHTVYDVVLLRRLCTFCRGCHRTTREATSVGRWHNPFRVAGAFVTTNGGGTSNLDGRVTSAPETPERGHLELVQPPGFVLEG